MDFAAVKPRSSAEERVGAIAFNARWTSQLPHRRRENGRYRRSFSRRRQTPRAGWETASKLGPRTELMLESLTPGPRNRKSTPVDALIVHADAANPFAIAMIWQSDMPLTRFVLHRDQRYFAPHAARFYNEAAPKSSVVKPDCPAQIPCTVLKTVVIATVSAATRSRLGSRRDKFRRQRC